MMMPTIAIPADAAAVPTEVGTGCPEHHEVSRRHDCSRVRRKDSRPSVGTDPESDPALTLGVAARDYIWLYDFRHGINDYEIAARNGVTVRQVRSGLERARELDRKLTKDNILEDLKPGRLDDLGFRLTPLFPIGAFTPQSSCPHHKSLKPGTRLCCMVCHASGMDDHPGLRSDRQVDPSPEPEPEPASDVEPAPAVAAPETRKQRRRRQFAEAREAQARL